VDGSFSQDATAAERQELSDVVASLHFERA
jgi:hypothetical protein